MLEEQWALKVIEWDFKNTKQKNCKTTKPMVGEKLGKLDGVVEGVKVGEEVGTTASFYKFF